MIAWWVHLSWLGALGYSGAALIGICVAVCVDAHIKDPFYRARRARRRRQAAYLRERTCSPEISRAFILALSRRRP